MTVQTDYSDCCPYIVQYIAIYSTPTLADSRLTLFGSHRRLIGALWGVLVFGEIKGRDNMVLLLASGMMRVVAVGLIAASKEGF